MSEISHGCKAQTRPHAPQASEWVFFAHQVEVASPACVLPDETVPFEAIDAEAPLVLVEMAVRLPDVPSAAWASPEAEAIVVDLPSVTSVDPMLGPAEVLTEV